MSSFFSSPATRSTTFLALLTTGRARKEVGNSESVTLKYNLHKRNTSGLNRAQVQAHEQQCIRIEGDFANELQRKSIFDLTRKLANKPKGLMINESLRTSAIPTGSLFKTEWLTLPIPVYVGLGNHDYENNVDDCVANQCANNMLYWQLYGSTPVNLDINCIHVVQLHNRPDYVVTISSASQWMIHGSLQWLLADLEAAKNHTWPILINLHNHNGNIARRLKTTLEQWYTAMNFGGNSFEMFLLQANPNATTSIMETVVFTWKPC